MERTASDAKAAHPARAIALGAVFLILVASWARPPTRAHEANLDTTADRVFGPSDFSTSLANRGVITPTANSLSYSAAKLDNDRRPDDPLGFILEASRCGRPNAPTTE